LRKPSVTEVVMKCAFWTLGEYGYLLSSKLANGHKKKKEAEDADDDVIRVEEDEDDEEENDEDDLVLLESVLNVICEVVDKTAVANTSPQAYGVAAIAKITAQLGKFTPRAIQSIEKHAASRDTELQQRCREFLTLVPDMNRVRSLLPVDASCEDFDSVDFSFLNEFTDILRAAGANEYQEKLRVVNDYDLEPGGSPLPSSSPKAGGTGKSNLRFDAYEAPKLYENTITPPAMTSAISQDNVDDIAKLIAAASSSPSLSNTPSQKPAVKNLWGPKGYTGTLPSLGGASQAQMSTSSSISYSSTPTAQATVTPSLQPQYSSTPDYDFVAAAAEDQSLEDLRPLAPAPVFVAHKMV